MAEDPGKETRIVDIKGRSVVVRQLNEAQYMLMAQMAKVVSDRNAGGEARINAATIMLRLFNAGIVQQEDRDYIQELNIEGGLEISDLLQIITVFTEDQPKKATVRRGPTKRR